MLPVDFGMSSFDLINIVCVLEDEFDAEIPDRAIGGFKTVGDAVDYYRSAVDLHFSFL